MNTESSLSYDFGIFRLQPEERLLFKSHEPVSLPPKVFDTLVVLVQNSGRLLSKADLMARLWPDTVVEEVNLARCVSHLRKVLDDNGQRYIETVPKSGYRFLASVEVVRTGKAFSQTLDSAESAEAGSPAIALGATVARTIETTPFMKEPLAPRGTLSSQTKGVRHWWVSSALAVIAAVLGFALWRVTRPVNHPLMRFSAELGPGAVEGRHTTAAISPDGSRLAFIARGSAGKLQVAIRPLDQAQAAFLAGTDNAVDPFFSPDGQWIGFFADGKLKKISVQGGAAITLCDAADLRGASWGEDGFIIATLTGAPDSGLSRIPAAGGIPREITHPAEKGEVRHRWAQVLPGGQAVLFTGNSVNRAYDDASIEVLSLKTGEWKTVLRGGYFGRYLPSGHMVYIHQDTLLGVRFDLNRLEVRGTPVPLLDDMAGGSDGSGQYDVARNGTLVYLSSKSSTATWPIAWLDRTGKMEPLIAPPGVYFSPRFSPDGKRLALAVGPLGRGDIQVYDWQREAMSRLTFTQANLLPVWTPDGNHIVFQSQSPGGSSLRWIRADGARAAQLLLESKGFLLPYSFSPDGKRLAFAESGMDARFDLWTLPLDISDPEHPKPGKRELFLRTPPFDVRDPAFSPDGRWMAYTSYESGLSEVFVRPFPGGASSGAGKWQISNGGSRYPIWSRSGRELFYYNFDGRIMVSTYTAKGDSFAPDKPRVWSSPRLLSSGPVVAWRLDLAPDGKRFAVFPRPEAAGEQQGSVHVTVLLNFFDELQRSVPRSGK